MSGEIKEIIAWLGALGIPTIFAMTSWCIKCCVQYTKQLKVLAKAQQAQMRSQLLEQYHFYMDSGWISEEHMEDWENQFHELIKADAFGWGQPTECNISPFTVIFLPAL